MPDPSKIRAVLAPLKAHEIEALLYHWPLWARAEQWPPAGRWSCWMFMGGRGAGKTRAGAEWVRAQATPGKRIALIGASFAEMRDVMVEGVSGLLSVHAPAERPLFEKTRNRLVWANGAEAQMYSADDPESLRGPQFHAAWCDELPKWRYAQEAYTQLHFALRLGEHPQHVITTTPRPVPVLKAILANRATAVTRATTHANAAHLAPGFIAAITQRYAGSRLGRQEIDGELIDDRADALWARAQIDAFRVNAAPELDEIVVAVDPAVSSGVNANATGLVVAGRARDGHIYVLADASLQGARPDAWAARAVALYHSYEANRLVAEVNQGGELVRSLIAALDADVPVHDVRATRGKWLRAEPVAALYARGQVHHVGCHAALEDEMCDFSTEGLSGARSPDRLDALVWAVTALRARVPRPALRRL